MKWAGSVTGPQGVTELSRSGRATPRECREQAAIHPMGSVALVEEAATQRQFDVSYKG